MRDNFRAGTRVRVRALDIDATVLAVGPVSHRLRSWVAGEGDVILPNHTLINSVVKASPLGDVGGADA